MLFDIHFEQHLDSRRIELCQVCMQNSNGGNTAYLNLAFQG